MSAMGVGQKPFYPPSSGWNKGLKGKPLQNADEIVYCKGTTTETMPSLSKQLKGVTADIVGLKYVWEYRSPSMTVAPLYHCKLCNVHQFQGHMIAHVSGWKHAIRYIIKENPDKITFTEEDIQKDPTLKKTLKEVTAELANSVGRGQLKVILKEPSTVPAFKGLLASSQKQKSKEQAGPPPARGAYRPGGFGGYASMQAPPDYTSDQFYDTGYQDAGYQETNEYGGYDYEQGGPPNDYQEYRRGPMTALEQPHRREGGSGDLSNTLLSYLDTFKIENESDAQLVLKVTQKLTDILMEYRLRGAPQDPSMPSTYSSQNFGRRPGYPIPPPKMPKLNEQFSGYGGQPRYSAAPRRF